MPKIKKDNSSVAYAIDEGFYKAAVVSIEEMDGKNGKYYKWRFKIFDPVRDEEEVDEDVILNGHTPCKLQDGSKLDKWLQACGLNSEDGDEVDTDDAEGSKVKVAVENTEKNDRVYSNVTKVVPSKKSSKKVGEEENFKKVSNEKNKEETEVKTSFKKKSKDADEDDDDVWDFD